MPALRNLLNNPILKSIAILGSGTVLAQAINIAATPLLATLYGPDSFGVMAVFMSIVLFAGSMASLTYDSAIVLSGRRQEAEALIALCVIITSFVTILVFAILAIIYAFGDNFAFPIHPAILALVPMGVFFLGVFNVASNWMTRIEAFKDISAANLIRSFGATSVQLILGAFGGASASLIIGRIFGQAAATIFLLFQGRLVASRSWLKSFPMLRRVAKRHYRFPAFRAPQAAIGIIAEQAPAFALGIFFGPTFAGLYWLADRILSLPCVILSESTAKVYYAEATKRHRNQKPLMPFLLKTILGLASIALVPSIILALFAPDILSILGNQWQPAGVYVQWMVLWIFFRFSCAPVMATYMILENQKELLAIDFIAMMLRLPCIVLAGLFGDPMTLVISVCLFESLKIFITVCHIIFCLHRPSHKLDITP